MASGYHDSRSQASAFAALGDLKSQIRRLIRAGLGVRRLDELPRDVQALVLAGYAAMLREMAGPRVSYAAAATALRQIILACFGADTLDDAGSGAADELRAALRRLAVVKGWRNGGTRG